MTIQPSFPKRKRTRLRGFDYSSGGLFFITICCQHRHPILGRFTDSSVELTPAGIIAGETWRKMPGRFAGLQVGTFVVMPDHFHGILILPEGCSLSRIIQTFKSISAREISNKCSIPSNQIWHRSFYDRIVRSEPEWEQIDAYIRANPERALLRRQNPGVILESPPWERNFP